jgi:hypothetical protein
MGFFLGLNGIDFLGFLGFSFLGYTFGDFVIRMEVRILRISRIGTDF